MIDVLKKLVVGIALAILAGCASGPGFKDVSSKIPPVSVDNGRIFFYRVAAMGAAVQPDVMLNKQKVGSAVPQGFFYADRPAGDYEVTTTTEIKKSLTFHLDAGQIRYVRLNIGMGFFVGHVYPELVEDSAGSREIEKTKSITKK